MPKLNKPEKPGYNYAHPGETSGKSLMPHPQERVFESQASDVERIKKGLDPARESPAQTAARRNAPQGNLSMKDAAGRAITRTAGRAGLAGAALEAGYGLGREIDERTGAGKAMVEKSGVGNMIDRAVNNRDKVELSEDSKDRSRWEDTKRTLREVDEDREASKYAKPDVLKRGGKVKPTASSRGDGIAQRGKTRGRYL